MSKNRDFLYTVIEASIGGLVVGILRHPIDFHRVLDNNYVELWTVEAMGTAMGLWIISWIVTLPVWVFIRYSRRKDKSFPFIEQAAVMIIIFLIVVVSTLRVKEL